MNYGTLNHCFKDFALRDFFNSLSHNQTYDPVLESPKSSNIGCTENPLQSL